MKKKIVSVLLASLMVTSMLAGCGNSSGSSSSSGTGGDTTSASGTEAGDTGLTAEEQEAVDEGIIQLDGTLPIIKDPAKFEEKYGKISALIVNSADRTVEVGDLAMCKKWFEDTGVANPAGERNRENQPDAFFRTGSSGCILELRRW